MIRYLKPTKLKLFAMVLIWASFWCADALEDIVGDQFLQQVSPETWSIIEEVGETIDESEGDEEGSYIIGGLALIFAEWLSRAVMTYLCACIIIGLADRRKYTEQINSGDRLKAPPD